MKKLFFLAGVISAGALAAQADTLADWTFETSQPAGSGPALTGVSPEVGSGSASGVHASSAAVFSTPAGNGSVHSFSANGWAPNDYWEFQVSTVGFQNISLSYDQTGSATGPKSFDLAYSTDGTTFTPFVTGYSVLLNGAPNLAWSPTAAVQTAYNFSVDLSSVAALNNASTVYFHLIDDSTTSINGGTVGTAGTDRVDNFVVSADPVPEPSSLCLMGGLGMLAATFYRRRK